MQSRYILEGEGGDQVCGRAASGLPLTEVSFATLPPHFLSSDAESMTAAQWEEVLPGYSTVYPLNFREVIPFLLASLVYHQPYLAQMQARQPRHPLFLQRVWTNGTLLHLKDAVGAGCSRNPISKMTVTGVPPNLVFANKMVDMQRDMCDMKDQIIAKLEQLPEAMKHSLLANFQINGTVPITRNEMQEVISTSIDSLRGSIESSFQLLSHRNENPLVPVEEQNDLTPQNTAVYTTWGWGGRLRRVPPDFVYPV